MPAGLQQSHQRHGSSGKSAHTSINERYGSCGKSAHVTMNVDTHYDVVEDVYVPEKLKRPHTSVDGTTWE